MKETSWNDCLLCRSARPVAPRKEQATSLREIAHARLAFLGTPAFTPINATFILETHYTATLEVLHAFLLMKGYSVENHVCIAYYLRDVLNDEHAFKLFDEARLRRNALVYYGQHTDPAVCERLIKGLQSIREKMKEDA